MRYSLIIANTVRGISLSQKEGLVEVDDSVVCGMVRNNEVDNIFSIPAPIVLPPSKEEQLNTLIVTVNAKRFYADPESRTDIVATIIEAQDQGATNDSVTPWKTPDGVMSVTLAELKEASKLALEAKAGLIGVL